MTSPAERFRRRFHRPPAVGGIAPGRVNLIGDHTDYADGLVLPIAIDRSATVLAGPAAHPMTTIASVQLGTVHEVDFTHPIRDRRGTGADRLLGVAAGFQARGAALPNLDVLIDSDVPVGAGLSSSAAIETAFAVLLEQICPPPLPSIERARLCRDAEHRFAGTPCGIMDPLVSSAGVPDAALLIDCRGPSWSTVAIDHARLTVLVVDSGVRHDLGDGRYAALRTEIESAAERLGVAALRDADEAMLDAAALPSPLDRRARHVIRENARVQACAAALAAGDLDRVGALMTESHHSLRDDLEVSCTALEVIVDAAASCLGRGVFGARLTGGGFGGCAVVACAPESAAAVTDIIGAEVERRSGTAPAIMAVRASGGAGAWRATSD